VTKRKKGEAEEKKKKREEKEKSGDIKAKTGFHKLSRAYSHLPLTNFLFYVRTSEARM